MRVTVIDPPAYTPPYDHSLCAALAARGLEVELATSRFRFGQAPRPLGYARNECFYRFGGGSKIAKAIQHPFEMERLARRLRRSPGAVTHFQWLPLPQLDVRLVSRFPRPRVLTAHDLLPREAGSGQRQAARKLFDRMDALVVHSNSGRAQLTEQLGVAPELVHVIPHGSFDYLTAITDRGRLDPAVGELQNRKVVLFFGLIRPYKGVDLLIDAFAAAPDDAVLIVAGMPRMSIEPLRSRVAELGLAERVRFVPRFIPDSEVGAYFERADLVVLPYRETEQSGVLFTSLAFGKPTIATDVGGFSEVGSETGAVRLVPPGDSASLGATIAELLGDAAKREQLAAAARAAAAGPYSWSRAAELTEQLYVSLGAAA